MRIFVAGSSGQLARALKARALSHGHIVETFGRPALDLGVPDDFEALIAGFEPDLVINAAGYTAVDGAESAAGLAMAINRCGAAHLAATARRLGLPFLHVSTDYVFDGEKGEPYVENDTTNPLGAYGRSKCEGEARVRVEHPDAVIVRTGWVYSQDGGNFVHSMVRLAATRERLEIVADRFGNPTYAGDLADGLLAIAGRLDRPRGVFHLAGAIDASWYALAAGVMDRLEAAGLPTPELVPISGDNYSAPARRPRDSRLDCSLAETTFKVRLPGWPESLGVAVAAILNQERNAA
jgi:dTDP-4-dehydrorhamnose reductase